MNDEKRKAKQKYEISPKLRLFTPLCRSIPFSSSSSAPLPALHTGNILVQDGLLLHCKLLTYSLLCISNSLCLDNFYYLLYHCHSYSWVCVYTCSCRNTCCVDFFFFSCPPDGTRLYKCLFVCECLSAFER